ncbi:MAG: septum formation initiator family protein [Ruminococcaceae bacterium]|nr:septum formation initiator family protein [Oscillospiraceae bacterium]
MKKKKKVDLKVLLKRGLLCVLVLYMGYLLIAQQFDLARLGKENDVLDSKIAEAQKAHDELTQEKEDAETPEYIERVAREKLGYMKPEEKVFIDSKKQ